MEDNFDYKNYRGFLDPEADMLQLRDSRNVRKTETLFEETITKSSRERYEPLYSLKEQEKRGKPSAYKIYINSTDETEAALKLVGSLAHWRRLCGLQWFFLGDEAMQHEGLVQWRKDMEARDRMVAKKQLQKMAEEGSVPAAKKLLDEAGGEGKRGRPAKTKGKAKEKDSKVSSLHKDIFG